MKNKLTPVQAMEQFLDVFTDQCLLTDLGPKLTCVEAEAMANLLTAYHYDWAAKSLLDAHCLKSEEWNTFARAVNDARAAIAKATTPTP